MAILGIHWHHLNSTIGGKKVDATATEAIQTTAQHPRHRRFDRCIGWQCLTATEKFGIIFGISVTSIVLFLLYAYCLGKATASRRERESASHRTSMGRAERRSCQTASIALTHFPAWQLPDEGPLHVLYQPAIFSLVGLNSSAGQGCRPPVYDTTSRRPVTNWPTPPFFPQPWSSPAWMQTGAAAVRTEAQPSSTAESLRPTPWWQLVKGMEQRADDRGRAWTISSSSPPRSPCDGDGSHAGGYIGGGLGREDGVEGAKTLVKGREGCDDSKGGGTKVDERRAVRTMAATVHSEDLGVSPPCRAHVAGTDGGEKR